MEVGEEIRSVSVAYGAGDTFDEESATGSDGMKGDSRRVMETKVD